MLPKIASSEIMQSAAPLAAASGGHFQRHTGVWRSDVRRIRVVQGGKNGAEVKVIAFAALLVVLANSTGHADQFARFVAVSVTTNQGLRAIVSNVLAPANGAHVAPCPVHVNFFGPDGRLIGQETTLPLKAGESAVVEASQPSKLVRAVVSTSVDDPAVCTLRTGIEVFDKQTGTTFVSVPGEIIGGPATRAPADVSGSVAPPPVRTPPKPKPPVLGPAPSIR